MASEQLSRRENATTERDIHVEKDRVPKMTTHFEPLSVQRKEPPQVRLDALQGGEINKEHAGKAIGDVGGRGKARETHELGSHFEPLVDKVKGRDDRKEKDSTNRAAANVAVGTKAGEEITKGREGSGGARAAANVAVGTKAGEEATKGREGFVGARDVGKFEMKTEGKSLGNESLDRGNLERRTRVVAGTPENKERNIGLGKGEVVAEKGRRGKVEEARGAEEKLRGRRVGAEARGEEKLRGRRVGAENEGAIWGEQKERGEREGNEEEKRSSLEEISKYRNQAQQSAMDAISAAQGRYERAKQATNETLSSTTQTAQERTAQAKEIAMEKASQAKEKSQQGYEATKDTVSSAAKTAAEYTTPVVEKAKCAGGSTVSYVGEKAVQAKDVTVETGKTAAGYAGKVAADLKDKATVAGWTAANYSAELTVEGTKVAANVVEGAAGYAGHKAAELAAKSVVAVKGLAASAGETAKEYTARKKDESWREYEAKRAAQPQEGEERSSEGIGETVSDYAQKVIPSEESTQGIGQAHGTNQRGSNVMSATGETVGNVGEKVKKPQGSGQAQGTNQRGSNVMSAIGETVGNVGEKVKKPFENINSGEGKRENQSSGQVKGKRSEAMTTNIGEKLGDAAQTMKKPIENITEGGSEVLGAVTETVSDIGSNMMKSAERVQERGAQEGQKSGGVLDAIGETIAEIAQTTKVIVVGEDEKDQSRQNIGSDTRSTARVKHGVDQAPQRA